MADRDEAYSMNTHLTIVRHGTTVWMERGLIHGRLDSPLSALGLRQVRSAARALAGRHFDAFYASPTGRAWETARLIGQEIGLQPAPLELLVEQDFGALEGTAVYPSPGLWLGLRMAVRWMIPFGYRGESIGTMYRRGAQALELLARQYPGGSVLVVSHSGLINMMLKHLSRRFATFFLIPPGSIIEVELGSHGRGRLLTPLKTTFKPRATRPEDGP
jgi:probable phosphoglycerate mutase